MWLKLRKSVLVPVVWVKPNSENPWLGSKDDESYVRILGGWVILLKPAHISTAVSTNRCLI